MISKLLASLMIVAGFLAAGCNTISGAGKDIEAGGNAIEGAAERSK